MDTKIFKNKYSIKDLEELQKKFKSITELAKVLNEPRRTVSHWMSQINKNKSNILCISDLHIPAIQEGYIEWCLQLGKKHRCQTVVLGGDVLDNDYLKKYTPDLDYYNPSGEYKKAKEILKNTLKQLSHFSKIIWVLGNHDIRLSQKIERDLTPGWFIKSLREVYEVPESIIMEERYKIDNILFQHQGRGTTYPHIGLRDTMMCNAVVFHAHSRAGIDATRTEAGFLWGAVCGCGCDENHPALKYARKTFQRQILACLVIEQNQPFLYFKH